MARSIHSLLSFALGIISGPVTALAQEQPMARLTIVRGPNTDRCLSEQALRAAVSARLGRDPFDEHATLTVHVRLESIHATTRATLTRIDASGPAGQRSISSRREDCADLGPALGLAIGLVIDPLAQPPIAPPVVTAPVEPVAVPVALPVVTPVVTLSEPPPELVPAPVITPVNLLNVSRSDRPSPLPVRVLMGAEASVTVAELPTVSLGPAMFASLRVGRFGVALTGRYDLAWPAMLDGTQVLASLVSGSLSLCALQPLGSVAELDFCAMGSGGALAANATQLDRSTPVVTASVYAGVSAGATYWFGRWFGLRVHVDGLGAIVRARYTFDDAGRERELWLAPPFALVAGIGPVLRFH